MHFFFCYSAYIYINFLCDDATGADPVQRDGADAEQNIKNSDAPHRRQNCFWENIFLYTEKHTHTVALLVVANGGDANSNSVRLVPIADGLANGGNILMCVCI